MTRRHKLAIGLFLSCLLAGCRREDTNGDGGEPLVEIGTGGIERYVPVEDGDTMELARGCQGSQHLWIGLRAYGLDTQPALVSLSAIRVADEQLVSIPTTVRLRFQHTVAGYDQITGIQLVIPDPDEALAGEIDVNARVAEDIPGGRMARATRRVNVVWGDEVCGGTLGDGGPPDGAAHGVDGGPVDATVPSDGGAADAHTGSADADAHASG